MHSPTGLTLFEKHTRASKFQIKLEVVMLSILSRKALEGPQGRPGKLKQ